MRKKNGFSLITLLIGLALASGLTMMVIKVIDLSVRSQKRTIVKASMEEMRATIRGTIDCDGTLSANGISDGNMATQCLSSSTSQAAPFIRLRKKTRLGTDWMVPTWNADGTSTYGEWRLRVSCSYSERTLIVRAARIGGSGFEKDSLSGATADWSSSAGLLFGTGDRATPLCSTSIGDIPATTGIAMCPANNYMIGLDMQLRTPICRSIIPAPIEWPAPGGQKFQSITQLRNGTVNVYWANALPIVNCSRWTPDGHSDFALIQNSCPPPWTNAGVLGYAYH